MMPAQQYRAAYPSRIDRGRVALPDGSTIPPEELDQPAPTLSLAKGGTA